MNQTKAQQSTSTENTAKIVYILYLAGIIFPVTAIIGVVMSYINKNDAPDWLKSHYRFQVRTFWIGTLYALIGIILTFVLIGWLVLLFCAIWLIVRCVKGMKSLDQKLTHPNPAGWMF